MIKINRLPLPLRKTHIFEKLVLICETNDVTFLGLFGSFVNGRQNKKSDVDIAIEFDRKKDKDLFDLVHLERALRKVFKRKVDLGIYSSIHPHVRNSVRKEMRVLYEKR